MGCVHAYTESMHLSHFASKCIGRRLIAVLLFAQFAVASYACPKMLNAASPEQFVAQPAAMPTDCDQAGYAPSNLCAEHCRYGEQTSDTAAVPTVSAAVLWWMYSIPAAATLPLIDGRSFAAAEALWAAVPEPPLNILHCVLRI